MCGAHTKSALPNSTFSTTRQRENGIMRVRTLKESLFSCDSNSTDTSNHSVDLKRDNSLDKGQTSTVRFSEVHIREYAVTIGDNPSCSSGAPIRSVQLLKAGASEKSSLYGLHSFPSH